MYVFLIMLIHISHAGYYD